MGTSRTTDIDDTAVTSVLIQAATTAGLAPSIHNTQPWRWRIHGVEADLLADTARWLRAGDPDRRLLTISCGAALHHARVALAAAGASVAVGLLPTSDNADHLARITVTGHTPVTPSVETLHDAIRVRRTDRRPLLDVPLSDSTLAGLRHAADAFDTGLHVLRGDEVPALAAGIEQADHESRSDRAVRTELDAWVGDDHRPAYAGIPVANLPNRVPPTPVPNRDFGHVGALATAGGGHDAFATYAILCGNDDTAAAWLRAGEALSAVWLDATERGLAVLPLSAVVEHRTTRELLDRILAGRGHAAIVLRIGTPNPNQPVAPQTPRLPATATIDIE